MCPRYCFIFEYEFLDKSWSFKCIYADDLKAAEKEFEKQMEGNPFYFIRVIDRKDNRHWGWEKEYEPYERVFTAEN